MLVYIFVLHKTGLTKLLLYRDVQQVPGVPIDHAISQHFGKIVCSIIINNNNNHHLYSAFSISSKALYNCKKEKY